MTETIASDNDDPIEILLVEDNPGDVRLIEEVFRVTNTETKIRTITDGQDAIDTLTRSNTTEPGFRPDIALIDLNLPRKDGCDVLEAIRDDPRLRRLPVIMLTTSDDRNDIVRCYNARANAYLTKPTDPSEFFLLAKAIEEFWFERARLPATL